MEFGLNEIDVAKLNKVFSEFPVIDEVVIYGSRAKGNFRNGSDIDITLKGDIDLETLNKISAKLDDLLLPYLIDLSIFRQISNSDLVDHIHRIGKVFYKRRS